MSLRPEGQLRSFHHREFTASALAAQRAETVSVCLPAREEARTIGPILAALLPMRAAGLVDQVVVVDHSEDGTADIARAAGAEVHDQAHLRPELGPVQGKGDAMWRALEILHGDIVVFLDADSEGMGAHYLTGLLGPLWQAPGVELVKGFYRRPFRAGSVTLPHGGGRVTELTARPLLRAFYPELAGVRQPLGGEVAARRRLLERLAFPVGYGVDIGLLLEAYALLGAGGLAQVDLDVRQNAHQSLDRLGPMADEVLAVVTARLEREGRLSPPARAPEAGSVPVRERPPRAGLRAAA